MAFASLITRRTRTGNRRLHYGTFNSIEVSGGSIDTGLEVCEAMILTPFSRQGELVLHDVISGASVKTVLPAAGSSISIDTPLGVPTTISGAWMATGR